MFAISIAIVIFPTPPGHRRDERRDLARRLERHVADEPRARLLASASGIRFMPTSITTAPGFTMSPVTISARPAATMRMSARRVCAREIARAAVAHGHGRVAPPGCTISAAIGLPTMLLRPTITHSAPASSRRTSASMYSTPAGVHGAKPSRSPIEQLADVHRMKAVDVLVGANAAHDRVGVDVLRAAASARGCRAPRGSAFSRSTIASELGLARRRRKADRLAVHAELVARAFLGADVDRARRVVADEHDGESGRRRRAPSAATRRATFACTCAASAAPSISLSSTVGSASIALSGQSPPPSFRESPRP